MNFVRLSPKKILGVATSRFSGTLLQFVVLALIGNLLGTTAVGAVGAAQAFILSAGALATGGAPLFVLRRTATNRLGLPRPQAENWLKFSNQWVLFSSLITVLAIHALSGYLKILPDLGSNVDNSGAR